MFHSLPFHKLRTDRILVSLALWSDKVACYTLYHIDYNYAYTTTIIYL